MLSVIIPLYNHQDYILDNISSVIALDKVLEVIIIDDASTDNSVKVVEEYIEEFNIGPKLVLIKKDKNAGLVDSLIIGLRTVSSKYVYICASDDIPLSEGLSLACSHAYKNQYDFLICGGYNLFPNGANTEIYGERHVKFFENSAREKIHLEYLVDHPAPLLIQSTIFRKEVVSDIFDCEVSFDDYPLFFNLLEDKSLKYEFLPSIKIVKYRHHGNNSYSDYKKMLLMYKQFYLHVGKKYSVWTKLGMSNKYAYFLLKLLSEKEFRSVWSVLRTTSILEFFLALCWFPKLLLDYARKK